MFGKLVMGKEVTCSMWAGTFVIIGGVLLTVLSASVVGTLEADFDYLFGLWANAGWHAYLVLSAVGGALLQTTHHVYAKAKREGTLLPHSDLVLPITYATFSALFGTMSVVMAKVLSELISLQIEHDIPVRSE